MKKIKKFFKGARFLPESKKLWDFSEYIPQLVIINLGANDGYRIYKDGMFDKDKLAFFYENYCNLITGLREVYGDDMEFLLCEGFMDLTQYPYWILEDLKKNYYNVDDKISIIVFPKVDANGHLLAEHQIAGCYILYNKIIEIFLELISQK